MPATRTRGARHRPVITGVLAAAGAAGPSEPRRSPPARAAARGARRSRGVGCLPLVALDRAGRPADVAPSGAGPPRRRRPRSPGGPRTAGRPCPRPVRGPGVPGDMVMALLLGRSAGLVAGRQVGRAGVLGALRVDRGVAVLVRAAGGPVDRPAAGLVGPGVPRPGRTALGLRFLLQVGGGFGAVSRPISSSVPSPPLHPAHLEVALHVRHGADADDDGPRQAAPAGAWSGLRAPS